MDNSYTIYDVNSDNIDKVGFFCYMSKKKEPGYLQKRQWLDSRFNEGMKIKILHENGGRDTGFIEYIPGEFAWRAVHAPNYLVIHCLWVVGRGKDKGFGSELIKSCVEDARLQGKQGVAMVTTNKIWLAKKDIFLKNGFKEVDQAQGVFQLLTIDFGAGGSAKFPVNWEERASKYGDGLTVLRTAQCPYIENGTNDILRFAEARGIASRTVTYHSAGELQENSPTPYGVFGTVLDGKLLAYHYLLEKDFEKLINNQN
jgi:hypothetical protein